MLRIYTVSLRVAADAADAADRIGRKDPDPDVRQRLDHVIGTLVNLTR